MDVLPLSLEGKRAMVCGSTDGIGYSAALQLAKQGAAVSLLARNEEKLAKVMKELASISPENHTYAVADFDNPDEVTQAVEGLLNKNGAHAILINNSGGPAAGPIETAAYSDFVTALRRHLQNNHQISLQLLAGMKKSGYGRIVNIVSTSVYEPIPGLGVSNTVRGAVAGWAKTLSMEVAAHQITVNNVLPGATWTGRLESIIETKASKQHKTTEEVKDAMLKEIPSRRFASPEEVAFLIGFLSSPSASYITGTSIPVDGGRMHKI